MGYRSNMTAYVHGTDLLEFIQVLKDTGLVYCFSETEPMDEDGITVFKADDLKWYLEYPDVAAVTSLFNKSNHSYLLREGEGHYEDGDDDEYYTNNSNLYLH